MKIEGELYRIRDYAENVVGSLVSFGGWMAWMADKHGREHVTDTLARIMRKRFANMDGGTFTMTLDGLRDAISECRDYYFDGVVLDMMARDLIAPYLDKDGTIKVGPPREEK